MSKTKDPLPKERVFCYLNTDVFLIDSEIAF